MEGSNRDRDALRVRASFSANFSNTPVTRSIINYGCRIKGASLFASTHLRDGTKQSGQMSALIRAHSDAFISDRIGTAARASRVSLIGYCHFDAFLCSFCKCILSKEIAASKLNSFSMFYLSISVLLFIIFVSIFVPPSGTVT